MASPTPTTAACAAGVHAVTPSDLVAEVRDARARAGAAEVEVLVLAVAWAHAHPDPDPDQPGVVPVRPVVHDLEDPAAVAAAQAEGLGQDDCEWAGIPAMAWHAAAPFAAANAMTTAAGRALLRDALVIHHRLPLLWARVVAGQVAVWRARRVAQRVLGRPDDVAAHVDAAVEARAGQVGAVVLDRLLDAALIDLYPEQREAEHLAAQQSRHATLQPLTGPGVGHLGLAEMTIRADLPDVVCFDTALSQVAAALAAEARAAGPEAPEFWESHDTRRARAVGILADPAAAHALLTGNPGDDSWADKTTRRRVELVVHLTDLALLGADPTATHTGPRGTGTGLTASLDATVRAWCGQPGTRVTVRPVLDLTTEITCPIGTGTYQPSPTLRAQVIARDQTCVFPHCTRPATGCDLDHLVPWRHGGPTSTDNLAALCRRHHRLKTHAGWTYHRLGPPGSATYLWTDPHQQTLLRTPHGTRDLTGPPRPHPQQRPGEPQPSAPLPTSATRSAIESTTSVGR